MGSGHAEQQCDLHVRDLAGRRLVHGRRVFVCIDEEQGGRAVHVAKRGNGTEQGSAVAAVDEREATSPQDRAHSGVHGIHHVQQCSLVHEAGQMTSGRIGFGHHDVGADTCAGERRGQSGITEP